MEKIRIKYYSNGKFYSPEDALAFAYLPLYLGVASLIDKYS